MGSEPSAAAAECFGVDLAWSDNHRSGVCALDGSGSIVDERLLETDDEIVAWVTDRLDGRAVLAIDAPLLVPNDTGRRPGESAVAAAYGGRKAGPHSSNRSLFLRRYGRIRGEDLVARFADLGFADPWADANRTILEVYPHPALIEAFGLHERLRYKAKPGLGPDGRRTGLRNLSRLLGSLGAADPPLIGESVEVPSDVRGEQAKAIEDRLDARVAAWVAAVWARHGTARIRLFGDATGGHIAIPIGPFVSDPPQLDSVGRSVTAKADEPDLVELNRRQLTAYLADHETDLLESLTFEDYLVAFPFILETREQVIAGAGNLDLVGVSVTTQEVRSHGDTTVIVGTASGDGTINGQPFPPMRYMTVFGRVNGEWKLISRALMPIIGPPGVSGSASAGGSAIQ